MDKMRASAYECAARRALSHASAHVTGAHVIRIGPRKHAVCNGREARATVRGIPVALPQPVARDRAAP